MANEVDVSDANDDRPMFMSAEHVRRMNALLAASDGVRQACAALPRDVTLGYRLDDEASGGVHWWQMHFSRRDGVHFALQPDAPADVRFDGGYWAMLDNMAAQREGKAPSAPQPQAVGDASVIELVMPAFTAAQDAARIPVRMPVRRPVRDTGV